MSSPKDLLIIKPMKPPIEFCPECHSLKRKPNKECKNHEKYWIDKTQHLIEITKEKKKYIVYCVGDYGDLVIGRNTAYDFSRGFTTFKKASLFAKKKMEAVKADYEKYGKKAHVRFVENV